MDNDPDASHGQASTQLLGAIVAAMVLVFVLYETLGTKTDQAYFNWLFGGLGGILLLGALLRVFVHHGLSVVATTAGLFAALAIIGLVLVAATGDVPAGRTGLTLLVGVPAAGVAAIGATAAIQTATRRGDPDGTTARVVAALVCGVGFLAAASSGTAAYQAVDDARSEARDIADLEAAGLTPYLPEIEGWEPEFGAITRSGETGEATSYSLSYRPEGGDWNSPTVYIDVGSEPETICEDALAGEECRNGDGYQVLVLDGRTSRIIADRGRVDLVASFDVIRSGGEHFPSADAIGRALADADDVEWDDIFALD